MAFPVVFQGQDDVIEFTVEDEDGNVVDLTNYSIFIVYLYYENGKQTLEKYSSDALAGFNNADLKPIDLANGRFDINLQSSVTETANLGNIVAEIKAKTANTEFANNSFKDLDSDIDVMEIKKAVTVNDTLD